MINGGFDNVLVTPNGKVHKLLTKLAFLNLGHPFQPFIMGQRLVGAKVALEKKNTSCVLWRKCSRVWKSDRR